MIVMISNFGEGELSLDHIALVTTADDKLIDSIGTVAFHNVPKDRLAPNFNHRLWFEVRLFTDASTQPTSKDDCFHALAALGS